MVLWLEMPARPARRRTLRMAAAAHIRRGPWEREHEGKHRLHGREGHGHAASERGSEELDPADGGKLVGKVGERVVAGERHLAIGRPPVPVPPVRR